MTVKVSSSTFQWDLKGRAAVASIYPEQRDKVLRSQAWLAVVGKPLMWVLERAIDLERVGFLYGPNQLPEMFACLLVRLLQITPKPDIIWTCVAQDTHKYLRVLAMIVIRLIGNEAMYIATMQVCLEDYRNIRMRHADGTLVVAPLDTICEYIHISDEEKAGEELGKVADGAAAISGGWNWLGLRLTKRLTA